MGQDIAKGDAKYLDDEETFIETYDKRTSFTNTDLSNIRKIFAAHALNDTQRKKNYLSLQKFTHCLLDMPKNDYLRKLSLTSKFDNTVKNTVSNQLTEITQSTVDITNDTTVSGGANADTIGGGGGADIINGGAGADIITPGAGADIVTPGADSDIIIFEDTGDGDTIIELPAADKLNVDALIGNVSATGSLVAHSGGGTITDGDIINLTSASALANATAVAAKFELIGGTDANKMRVGDNHSVVFIVQDDIVDAGTHYDATVWNVESDGSAIAATLVATIDNAPSGSNNTSVLVFANFV